ncbi:hypothetical protein [Paenibacillus polymyxa]|uniref:hypothetical protein n=1 Tax=Paenibacillus polymyxa TaxID=1406 RepID=UPI00203514FA|nr:hypothetical protein [Paenibacillus polymyxa]
MLIWNIIRLPFPPAKRSDAVTALLEETLKATWSPDQITERFRVEGLLPFPS